MWADVIYNGVGVDSKGSSMRLNGPEVSEQHGIFAGLHCTDEGQQPETSTWMSAVCL